ncbi:hypothetical protein Q765_12760 [Flavobacterium rivuli WB 3.3-2 = DSM 21788]|uniref:Secretion system C-terminal sorting domain-containing protein n=1 Tax=Flavobacterium rivuli WB 3.3-2 = DSM 21788 TaxID=1121895 RepID=A0A0A2M439_9FLAO|nr:T9SS type A sorting domain-containing protein [Flavobacterium rivuli]KGO86178.1 hypothetical protein Q765_12760 [Flavobacterium rivuli WB 3.3-2 = DSM 21788]
MKKTLLLATLMLGALTGINAQETISFETTEGFTLGQLSGQNGWIVTDDGNATAPNAINVIVSDELGTNAIKFPSTTNIDFGDIHASKMITPGNVFSITQKLYAAGRDVDFGSDMVLGTSAMIDGELVQTSGIDFDYEGHIQILTSYNEPFDAYGYSYVALPVRNFDADTWYTVKETFNINANTVDYYVNDVLVGSGVLYRGGVDAITYMHDALTTVHYVDDISVVTETAGLHKAIATTFSVSPNPASTVINITNNNNALVNSISVTDLNGRVIKTNQFTGVANAELNIADLSAGIYMLNITSNQGTVTKKVVKN